MLNTPDQTYLATSSDEDVRHVNASALSAISKLWSQKGDTLRLGGKAQHSSQFMQQHTSYNRHTWQTQDSVAQKHSSINAYKHQTEHFGTLKTGACFQKPVGAMCRSFCGFQSTGSNNSVDENSDSELCDSYLDSLS